MIAGIDFGARLSGNTCICYSEKKQARFYRASKGQDADEMINEFIKEQKPDLLAIDAPLSLPSAYCSGKGDLFYRVCDRQTSAMSPMFLGGLTARAMQLKRSAEEQGIRIIEAYPKLLAGIWKLERFGYKKKNGDMNACRKEIERCAGLLSSEVTSWHDLDALLAFSSGFRYIERTAISYGNADEGLIWC